MLFSTLTWYSQNTHVILKITRVDEPGLSTTFITYMSSFCIAGQDHSKARQTVPQAFRQVWHHQCDRGRVAPTAPHDG